MMMTATTETVYLCTEGTYGAPLICKSIFADTFSCFRPTEDRQSEKGKSMKKVSVAYHLDTSTLFAFPFKHKLILACV